MKLFRKTIPSEKLEHKYKIFYGGMEIPEEINPNCLVQYEFTTESQQAEILLFSTNGNISYQSDSFYTDMGIRQDQILVFHLNESDDYYDFFKYSYKFNYTMDYRLTSDIPVPYSESFSYSEALPLEKKTGFIAAFISNCDDQNHRMDYIHNMTEFVNVDNFGHCENNAKIPTKYQSPIRHLAKLNVIKNYKFTLAFENSDSEDYVTEQLYHPLSVGSVPIFRGCKNVRDMIPPISVIDANEFESPEELSKYLLYLDKNDTAYNEYLEWRVKGDFGNLKKARFFKNSVENGICALVERLNNLWINPYLSDWKRETNISKLGCQTCLNNFDIEKRRVPIEKNDTFVLPDYPLGEIIYSDSPSFPFLNETSLNESYSTKFGQYKEKYMNIFSQFDFNKEMFWWLEPFV
ncbi:hypothetical protein TRFO_25748 [Tritrichomonas foetus]|uniref:Fucosyltransferase n=1 Tax=Tritrichomonas foetus TaxID=1144522 RepID=A0A1J4K976_9EUKA|nr:hypothetical protein TRFO_25748 [Tritrichomonas foetus]|eukprot:OHT06260.1 hypothetical protein TRFO_25748 [Tritrichomonas foetus]